MRTRYRAATEFNFSPQKKEKTAAASSLFLWVIVSAFCGFWFQRLSFVLVFCFGFCLTSLLQVLVDIVGARHALVDLLAVKAADPLRLREGQNVAALVLDVLVRLVRPGREVEVQRLLDLDRRRGRGGHGLLGLNRRHRGRGDRRRGHDGGGRGRRGLCSLSGLLDLARGRRRCEHLSLVLWGEHALGLGLCRGRGDNHGVRDRLCLLRAASRALRALLGRRVLGDLGQTLRAALAGLSGRDRVCLELQERGTRHAANGRARLLTGQRAGREDVLAALELRGREDSVVRQRGPRGPAVLAHVSDSGGQKLGPAALGSGLLLGLGGLCLGRRGLCLGRRGLCLDALDALNGLLRKLQLQSGHAELEALDGRHL